MVARADGHFSFPGVLQALSLFQSEYPDTEDFMMAGNEKRRCSRWMQTARRFSWLLAVCMILNQSLILFDDPVEVGNSPYSCSLNAAAMPLSPSDCTLSNQDTRNLAPVMVRTATVSERLSFSRLCILPLISPSDTPILASLSSLKTANHLRV